MSNQIDPLTSSLNIQIIQTIDQLNLPIMQKHHLRILFHCLIILKSIDEENCSFPAKEVAIREWCNNKSQKFNDQKFNNLLYDQLMTTAKKLNNFSEKLGKNIKELEIDDLILLVQENFKNK